MRPNVGWLESRVPDLLPRAVPVCFVDLALTMAFT